MGNDLHRVSLEQSWTPGVMGWWGVWLGKEPARCSLTPLCCRHYKSLQNPSSFSHFTTLSNCLLFLLLYLFPMSKPWITPLSCLLWITDSWEELGPNKEFGETIHSLKREYYWLQEGESGGKVRSVYLMLLSSWALRCENLYHWRCSAVVDRALPGSEQMEKEE